MTLHENTGRHFSMKWMNCTDLRKILLQLLQCSLSIKFQIYLHTWTISVVWVRRGRVRWMRRWGGRRRTRTARGGAGSAARGRPRGRPSACRGSRTGSADGKKFEYITLRYATQYETSVYVSPINVLRFSLYKTRHYAEQSGLRLSVDRGSEFIQPRFKQTSLCMIR